VRALLSLTLLLAAAAAVAQPPAASPPTLAATAPAPKPATARVLLTTARGPITVELETERAPITSANFLRYVDAHRFDGIAIYRAMTVAPGMGLVQGGIRDDARKLFPPIALEPTSRTGLRHDDGALSMARAAPDSGQADFFIVVGQMPSLDADPSAPGDNAGFAVFGHVVDGMDIVRSELDAPKSADAPNPQMRGQMLAEPLRILTARRLP
jgi:peptidyl-prolyl cis-trans isomerase A (cyclophilin A)